jgi:hypothetical protein
MMKCHGMTRKVFRLGHCAGLNVFAPAFDRNLEIAFSHPFHKRAPVYSRLSKIRAGEFTKQPKGCLLERFWKPFQIKGFPARATRFAAARPEGPLPFTIVKRSAFVNLKNGV